MATECEYCINRNRCSEADKFIHMFGCFEFDKEEYKDIPDKYLPHYARNKR